MTGYSFHPLAETELVDAAKYYEARSTGLGHSFLAAVRHAIQQILAYPESSPVVRRGLRRIALRRFPYSLIYAIEFGEIKIIAVMHQKRRPSYWKGRHGSKAGGSPPASPRNPGR
ncbi:MAG TPA: type II toxin-antitoxin system RelE/ParE family toxin [Thermoanaerobaculia bacterium]|nr:type II toxin-antitoxin system RelE/ParE family toxin [Thermoanaerobaculia bacterium]